MKTCYNINDGDINVTTTSFGYFKMVCGDGREKLEVGSLLYTFIGGIKPIESIKFVSGEVEVIQFDVEPLDVYFAAGVLVHNKGTDSDPA